MVDFSWMMMAAFEAGCGVENEGGLHTYITLYLLLEYMRLKFKHDEAGLGLSRYSTSLRFGVSAMASFLS